jgi:hypothetical protein
LRAGGWSFAVGALFGTGLLISGMADPGNVQGFLDVTGDWRPQLLAVLGAAVLVAAIVFRVARGRPLPLWAARFHWPARRDIDARLVAGSALFGAGWALAGYCPGPALVSLGAASIDAAWFVAAMAAGMWLARRGMARAF